MVNKNEIRIASKNCANFGRGPNRGLCGGVMMRRDEDGRLIMWIDEYYYKKPCFAGECTYFNNIVLPGAFA